MGQEVIPFGLLCREKSTVVGARITPYGVYDAVVQTCPAECDGSTSPTTRSSIDSTGIINSDSDESNDDTGND